MSRTLLALLLVGMIFVASTAADDIPNIPTCGPREEFTECGTACEPSCDNPNPQVCTLQCIVGCQCTEGYLRKGDECVAQSDC